MIRVSAPGKLILAGEHAAVYGRPALVGAVDVRTSVTIGAADGTSVRLRLPDVGCEEETDWEAVREYGRRAWIAWSAYAERPGPDRLAALTTGDPAHVVKVALAETVRSLEAEPGGIAVDVRSELPVGAGFGSSASVAVATIAALSVHLTDRVETERVDGLALEVERRQHGRPSGADHATVLHGGIQWFERDGEGNLVRDDLRFEPQRLARLAVFHTGTPAESTGELVEAVRRRFVGRGEELEEILAALESGARALRARLEADRQASRGVGELLTRYELGLERLGVVPEAVCRSIRRVERAGGAAKISGAGALSGSVAGALLAYSGPDSGALDCLALYRRLNVELGAPGLRVEPHAERS